MDGKTSRLHDGHHGDGDHGAIHQYFADERRSKLLRMKCALLILSLIAAGCSSGTKRDVASEKIESRDCRTPLGILADGATASGFATPLVSGGARCQSGTLTCHDGVWTGSYIYPACTVMEAAP